MIVYIKIFFVKFLLNSLVDHKMRRTILQKKSILLFCDMENRNKEFALKRIKRAEINS